MLKDLFHFDLITLLVFLGTALGLWYKFLRKEDRVSSMVESLAEWSKQHAKECDEQRKDNNAILTELRTTNAHLITLSEGHEKRLDRVEKFVDSQ